ncbi:MAG: energy-coupling factor transporter ATPase [Erysipelotrichaceae bacterium]|nr:energy-coupling factor transporter ATPase [Erysipelotrichaceae bacterium]MDD3923804.1 energy-coupling factor transporter ATPase [Erysipelotrichaceae bacterium]MDD4641881.1 energy-coupling factor transporter ATPase [Erysipelotrichaceae bacterium]
MNILEIKDLSFSYDDKSDAVDQASFTIAKGSYTTIIGQNGSGKSTIAKLVIGLLEKKAGTIIVDGLELSSETIDKIRQKVGIVFQNPDNQFIGATVSDDIAFGLENHCVDPKEMDDIIHHFADEVNMLDYLQHEPTKLSGGQKQRVAIAGVLAMAPNILIFDEATSMLDPRGKKEINDLIDEIHEENDMTIISITHDIEEVVHSDHVIVLSEGKVIMEGKPEVVLAKEKELKALSLDVPFAYKLNKALGLKGIKLKEKIHMERLVDELCQLALKK